MLGTVDLYDPGTFKVHLVVIQPGTFCNIDCKYCYLQNRNSVHQMSSETLEQSLRFLFAQPERLSQNLVIAWHASEPMAIPLSFYKTAFDRLQVLAPDAVNIENSFQTNATLVTQEWCDFIKSNQVKIGVSIDGPQWLHDANRKDRAGRGTFSRVMRGIELLRANGINFGTIGVLSDGSLDFAGEMWRFYKDLGVRSMAFNCEDIEGEHLVSSLHRHTASLRVRVFFERLLQLRNDEAPEIHIRELDYFLDGVAHWNKDFRRIENVPLSILGIAWNGDISTFSPELLGSRHEHYGEFMFGNVFASTIADVLSNPQFRSVHRDIAAGVQQCRQECPYFCVCGGGAPSNKVYENGTFDSAATLACELHIKTIGNVALEFLEKQYGLCGNSFGSVRERLDRLLPLIHCETVGSPGAVSAAKARRAAP